MNFPINASCQCGQVTYKLFEAPQNVIACHCRECQKLSTSAFSVTAVVATNAIAFNGEMKQWTRIADSGNKNSGYFCPNCGTRIYQFNPDQPDSIKLKLKPVDKASESLFEPKIHVWTSEKLSWDQIPAGVKSAEKQR
jgi:hypothetical protein